MSCAVACIRGPLATILLAAVAAVPPVALTVVGDVLASCHSDGARLRWDVSCPRPWSDENTCGAFVTNSRKRRRLTSGRIGVRTPDVVVDRSGTGDPTSGPGAPPPGQDPGRLLLRVTTYAFDVPCVRQPSVALEDRKELTEHIPNQPSCAGDAVRPPPDVATATSPHVVRASDTLGVRVICVCSALFGVLTGCTRPRCPVPILALGQQWPCAQGEGHHQREADPADAGE